MGCGASSTASEAEQPPNAHSPAKSSPAEPAAEPPASSTPAPAGSSADNPPIQGPATIPSSAKPTALPPINRAPSPRAAAAAAAVSPKPETASSSPTREEPTKAPGPEAAAPIGAADEKPAAADVVEEIPRSMSKGPSSRKALYYVAADGLTLTEACLKRLEPNVDLASLDAQINAKFRQRHFLVVLRASTHYENDFLAAHMLRLTLQELVRALAKLYNGKIVKFEQRSAYVLFSTALEAIRASLSLWHYYRDYNMTRLAKTHVFITAGIDHGEMLVLPNDRGRPVDVFGDPVDLARALPEVIGEEGVAFSSSVQAQLDDAAKAQLSFEPVTKEVDGEPVNFFSVSNYKGMGISIFQSEKETNSRLLSLYPINVPDDKISVSQLCCRSLSAEHNWSDIRTTISERVGRQLPVVVCYVPGEKKIVKERGVLHWLSVIMKANQLLRNIFLKNYGQAIEIPRYDVAFAFPSTSYGHKAAAHARKAFVEYNDAAAAANKIHVHFALGTADIVELQGSSRVFYGTKGPHMMKELQEAANELENVVTEDYRTLLLADSTNQLSERDFSLESVSSGSAKYWRALLPPSS